MVASRIWVRLDGYLFRALGYCLLAACITSAQAPTPGPTPDHHYLGGFRVDWLSEVGILLFPILFLIVCFAIRMLWGCCAFLHGWGNRGRPPRKVAEEEVLDTTAAPFDWVIDGLTGQTGRDSDTSLTNLLNGVGVVGNPWLEQWDERYQAYYYWNKDTHETTWECPAGFSSRNLTSPDAPLGDAALLEAHEEQVLRRQRDRSTEVSDASLGTYEPKGGHSARGSFHGVADGHLELTSGQSLLGNGFHYSSGSSSDDGSGDNSDDDDEDDDRVGLLSRRSNSSSRSASSSFNSSFNGSFSGPPGSKRKHRRRSRSGRLSRNSFNQGYSTEAGLNELLASMRPDKGSFARSGRGSSSSWARGRPLRVGESGVLALDPTEATARAEESRLAAVEVRRLVKEGGLLPSEAAHEAAALVAQRRESRSFNMGGEGAGGAHESKQQDNDGGNGGRHLRMESVESAISLIENPNEDDDDDNDDDGPHRSYMKKARSLSDAAPSLQRHVELVEDAFLDSLLPSVQEEAEEPAAPEVKPKSRLSSFFGGTKKEAPPPQAPPPPASPPKPARPRSASGDEPPEGSLSLMVRLQAHGLLGERLGWNGKHNATAAAGNTDATSGKTQSVLLEEHAGPVPSAVAGGCVVVDPLGLHNLAAPRRASSSGGGGGGGGGGPAALAASNPDSVSAALYMWLGCEAAKRYPPEVAASVKAPGDAKLTKYSLPAAVGGTPAEVVHCAVPDLRRELFQPLEPPYSPHDAHELLSQAYLSIFSEFASANCHSRVLRLLPLCAATSRRGTGAIAVVAGTFAPALPVLTWAAMQEGYSRLSPEVQRVLSAKEVHLCIPALDDVPFYQDAGFDLKEGSDLPAKPPPQLPAVQEEAEEEDPPQDLFEALEDQELEGQDSRLSRSSGGSVAAGSGATAAAFKAEDAGMALGTSASAASNPTEGGNAISDAFEELGDQEDGSGGGGGWGSNHNNSTAASRASRDSGFKAEDTGMAMQQDENVMAAPVPKANDDDDEDDDGDDASGGSGGGSGRKAKKASNPQAAPSRTNGRQSVEDILALGDGATRAEAEARVAEQELAAMREAMEQKAAARRAQIAALEAEDDDDDDDEEDGDGKHENRGADQEEEGDEEEEEDEEEESSEAEDEEDETTMKEEAAAIMEDDGSEVPLAWSEAVKVASFGDFASGVQALKLEFLGPTLELTPDGNKTQPASSVPPLCAQGTFGYGFIRSARYCGQPVVVKNLGAAAKEGESLERAALLEIAKEGAWRFKQLNAFLVPLFAVNVDASPQLPVCTVELQHPCSLADLLHNPSLGGRLIRGHHGTSTSSSGGSGGGVNVSPDLLRALPLTLRQRLLWLRQVALGMSAVHAQGLLHGNLRPANVMLATPDHTSSTSTNGVSTESAAAQDGSVGSSSSSSSNYAAQAAAALAKAHAQASPPRFAGSRGCAAMVTDFGLQTVKKTSLGSATSKRAARIFKGLIEAAQLPYTAPEVLEGKALTAAADVYSFSVLCWEVLVGQVPLEGKNSEAIMKYTLAKKRLVLPTDKDLAQRWTNLRQHALSSEASYGAPPPPAKLSVLGSLRIAHRPLDVGQADDGKEHLNLRELVAKCGQHAPKERPSFQEVAHHLGCLAAQLPNPKLSQRRGSLSTAATGGAGAEARDNYDTPLPPLVLPAQAAAAHRRLSRRASHLDSSSSNSAGANGRRRSSATAGAAAASAAALAAADACLQLVKEGPAKEAADWAKGQDSNYDDDDDDFDIDESGNGSGASGTIQKTALPLSELCRVPVVLLNTESRRKLFAASMAAPKKNQQSGGGSGGALGLVSAAMNNLSNKKTWAEGFGAGPELHTFDDNRWWLVPQRNNNNSQGGITFALQNCHSDRWLFANSIKPPKKKANKQQSSASLLKASSAKQAEKGLGAALLLNESNQDDDNDSLLMPEDHLWRFLPVPLDGDDDAPDNDGSGSGSSGGQGKAYVLRNAASGRDLFARPPLPGEAWHVGVGAELALAHGDGLSSLRRHSRESTSGDHNNNSNNTPAGAAASGGEGDESSALLAPLHCRWLLLPQWQAAAQCGPHPAADAIAAIWGQSSSSLPAASASVGKGKLATMSSSNRGADSGNGAEPINEAEAKKVARIELDAERAAAQARVDAEAAEGLVESMRAAVALGTGDEAELQAALEVAAAARAAANDAADQEAGFRSGRSRSGGGSSANDALIARMKAQMANGASASSSSSSSSNSSSARRPSPSSRRPSAGVAKRRGSGSSVSSAGGNEEDDDDNASVTSSEDGDVSTSGSRRPSPSGRRPRAAVAKRRDSASSDVSADDLDGVDDNAGGDVSTSGSRRPSPSGRRPKAAAAKRRDSASSDVSSDDLNGADATGDSAAVSSPSSSGQNADGAKKVSRRRKPGSSSSAAAAEPAGAEEGANDNDDTSSIASAEESKPPSSAPKKKSARSRSPAPSLKAPPRRRDARFEPTSDAEDNEEGTSGGGSADDASSEPPIPPSPSADESSSEPLAANAPESAAPEERPRARSRSPAPSKAPPKRRPSNPTAGGDGAGSDNESSATSTPGNDGNGSSSSSGEARRPSPATRRPKSPAPSAKTPPKRRDSVASTGSTNDNNERTSEAKTPPPRATDRYASGDEEEEEVERREGTQSKAAPSSSSKSSRPPSPAKPKVKKSTPKSGTGK